MTREDLEMTARIAGKHTRRRVALGMLILVAITIGTTALVMSVGTQGDVRTIKQAGRCQSGDLAACRTAGVNIIRSCSPEAIGMIPNSKHRQDAIGQCRIIVTAIRQGHLTP